MSLFTGTIRSNLDPFGEHSDQDCWDVLNRCHLTPLLNRGSGQEEVSLDMPMSQGGSLSAGERQLVALARAVLRRTKIVILDEATSQIDSRLDEKVSCSPTQCYAHSLSPILDSDDYSRRVGGCAGDYYSPPTEDYYRLRPNPCAGRWTDRGI